MATRDCRTYNVMDGEPQLGKMTECSIYFTLDEVLEEISQRAVADGEIPPIIILFDQNDEEIEVDNIFTLEHTGDEQIYSSDYMTYSQHCQIEAILEKLGEYEMGDEEAQKLIYTILTEGLSKKQLFKTMEL